MNPAFFWVISALLVAVAGMGASSGSSAYQWPAAMTRTTITATLMQAEQSAESANAPVAIDVQRWGSGTVMIVSPPNAPAGAGRRVTIPVAVSIQGSNQAVVDVAPNGTLSVAGSPLSCPFDIQAGNNPHPIAIDC